MRLKIIALFIGLMTLFICMLGVVKIDPLNPLAFIQTPTSTATSSPTITPSLTPTVTKTPTPTRTPKPTRKPTKTATPTSTLTATVDPLKVTPIVIYAAGDIASCPSGPPDKNNGAMITSNMLLDTTGPVFTLGDNSNDGGNKRDYENCYNPTWGRLLDRTYPVMGNHDRGDDIEGAAYFSYFAGKTGKWGHYSLDLGAWHIVILNAECGIGGQLCRTGSAQERWLKADLAGTRQKCIMALWHQPLFTSGKETPFLTGKSFWMDLYAVKADIILNGHNHLYERFFPMNPDGAVAADGIREFVVGTGGAFLDPAIRPPLSSEMVRDSSTFGYLKLTLYEDSYKWKFVTQPGKTFSDSGSADCHR